MIVYGISYDPVPVSLVPRTFEPSELFPLLKLPFLALKEIFNSMTIKEIFQMARTTKKCKKLVKMFSYSKQFNLTIDKKYDIPRFKLHPHEEFYNSVYIKLKQKRFERDYIGWDVSQDEALSFFTDVFNPTVFIFYNSVSSYKEGLILARKYNLTIDGSFGCLLGDDGVEECLEMSEGIPDFNMSFRPKNEWIFSPKSKFEFDETVFSIPGNELHRSRMDLLLSLIDCRSVQMMIEYNCDDIYEFLKRWIEGCKMELLVIQFSEDFEEVFDKLGQGIPIEKAKMKRVADVEWEVLEYYEGGCYMIQQKDNGKKALVIQDSEGMHLTTHFEILSVY